MATLPVMPSGPPPVLGARTRVRAALARHPVPAGPVHERALSAPEPARGIATERLVGTTDRSRPIMPDHAVTASVQINAATGKQRAITTDECRAVVQLRPRVRDVMRRVLAEAYMREHAESRDVPQPILEDWEQAF